MVAAQDAGREKHTAVALNAAVYESSAIIHQASDAGNAMLDDECLARHSIEKESQTSFRVCLALPAAIWPQSTCPELRSTFS
eukprot:2323753-Amphidinium_carterae.2